MLNLLCDAHLRQALGRDGLVFHYHGRDSGEADQAYVSYALAAVIGNLPNRRMSRKYPMSKALAIEIDPSFRLFGRFFRSRIALRCVPRCCKKKKQGVITSGDGR